MDWFKSLFAGEADPDAKPEVKLPTGALASLKKVAGETGDVSKLIKAVAHKDLWQPDADEAFIIAAVERLVNPTEKVIKSWIIVKLRGQNIQARRVFVLTDQSFYTTEFAEKHLRTTAGMKANRHPLREYIQCRLGVIGQQAEDPNAPKDKRGQQDRCAMVLTLAPPAGKLTRSITSKTTTKYERVFLPLRHMSAPEQKAFLEEVAWAVYGVANRLLQGLADQPEDVDLSEYLFNFSRFVKQSSQRLSISLSTIGDKAFPKKQFAVPVERTGGSTSAGRSGSRGGSMTRQQSSGALSGGSGAGAGAGGSVRTRRSSRSSRKSKRSASPPPGRRSVSEASPDETAPSTAPVATAAATADATDKPEAAEAEAAPVEKPDDAAATEDKPAPEADDAPADHVDG